MSKEFHQTGWDDAVADDCRQLVRLAVREDLGRGQDWTTLALVAADTPGRAQIVAREGGVVAGLEALRPALAEMDIAADVQLNAEDGRIIACGDSLAALSGAARDLLTAERLLLNLLGRLSGIATLTRRYCDAVAGTKANIYDTRKTTPGWRRLEKYAVRRGGGRNHRSGLYDAILIKDNHLALAAGAGSLSPAAAVERTRQFAAGLPPELRERLIIEVEVDTLDQLRDVLSARPEIVLLDNMPPETLRRAVEMRDKAAPGIQLEASGGITLQTVRAVAESGVERISVGALTHSAVSLDVALDWVV